MGREQKIFLFSCVQLIQAGFGYLHFQRSYLLSFLLGEFFSRENFLGQFISEALDHTLIVTKKENTSTGFKLDSRDFIFNREKRRNARKEDSDILTSRETECRTVAVGFYPVFRRDAR